MDAWQVLLEGLEGTALAVSLRASEWAYPLVNTAHILGIALLVGSVFILDWRLLRRRVAPPVDVLAKVLLPVARGGFVLALSAGGLMFVVRPMDYAFNVVFQLKLASIALALLNILLLHRSEAWRVAMLHNRIEERVRLAGGLSLVCWLLALCLGRLVGYR